MKLNELAIDGFGVCRDLRLGPFNNGLNVVFGDTGTGKTTLRNFVRGVLYGFDQPLNYSPIAGTNLAGGQVDVRYENCDYRLVRDVRLSGDVRIQSLNNSVTTTPSGVEQLSGNLDLSLFDTIFSVGFHDTRTNVAQLANNLHLQLGVPRGSTSGRDEVAYARWQSESETISRRIGEVQQRIDSLTIEKRGYESQIEQSRSLRDQQLASVEKEINEVNVQIAAIDIRPLENRIAHLASEIRRLRESIDNSEVQYATKLTSAPSVPQVSPDVTLYQRLDELDNQIRRWRRVQSDIQDQRVRLRDEMLEWSELTLDSTQHPYHNARGILGALESKLDKVESYNKSSTTIVDQQIAAQQMDELCKNMRSDIYNLCTELGRQYKHIRQKSAAAELKQLRRCYTEMNENTERLVERRQVVLQELRRVDPAGAEAIERADQKFCQCAQHEGHLEARRRFVGNLPAATTVHTPVVQQIVRPDLTNLKAQLHQLETQLAHEQATRNRLSIDLRQLQSRHAELASQRQRLLAQLNQNDLIAKINNVEVELRRLSDQYNELNYRLQNLEYVETTHPLIERAANYLSQMTMNELSTTWLGAQAGDVVAKDRLGNEIPFASLSRGQQDQVYLSLILAARDMLATVSCPMLLDDVFANLDSQRVAATYDVIQSSAQGGNQTIVFAKGNEVARPNMSTNVTVFELPPRIAPAPYTTPERQPAIPARPLTWEASSQIENKFYQSYNAPVAPGAAPRSYPLSKYPRTGSRSPITADSFDEFSSVRAATFDAPRAYESSTVIEAPSVFRASEPESVAVESESVHVPINESSRIVVNEILDSAAITMLNRVGVRKVSELLAIDSDNLNYVWAEAGISNELLVGWQNAYQMLICIPELSYKDVRILAACGIETPEEMDTTNSQQLLTMIQNYFSGSTRLRSSGRYNSELLNRWYRSLDSNRSKWNRSRSRRQRSSTPRLRTFDASERRSASERQNESRSSRSTRAPRSRSRRERTQPMTTTPMVKSFTERQRTERPSTTRTRTEKSTSKKKAATDSGLKLKFYLDLDDHIEAAPSIGARTAERFEKIDVSTIRTFLAQTAESMANKLNYKRITADTIREWQHQARLVCRIPNLRGHDAQLLVACDFLEPEDISAMQPSKLLDVIGPFSDTKEGLKIIRTGKKPDLDEIKDWITWAGYTRPLQAA